MSEHYCACGNKAPCCDGKYEEPCDGCRAALASRSSSPDAPPERTRLRMRDWAAMTPEEQAAVTKWLAVEASMPAPSQPAPSPVISAEDEGMIPVPSQPAGACPVPTCRAGMLTDASGRESVSCPICDGTLTVEAWRSSQASHRCGYCGCNLQYRQRERYQRGWREGVEAAAKIVAGEWDGEGCDCSSCEAHRDLLARLRFLSGDAPVTSAPPAPKEKP